MNASMNEMDEIYGLPGAEYAIILEQMTKKAVKFNSTLGYRMIMANKREDVRNISNTLMT